MPLHGSAFSVPCLAAEIGLTSIYTVAVLVLPCFLHLNRMKRFWIGIVTLPLVLVPGNYFLLVINDEIVL